jgi:uncharacterized damage-inducible protein DinB
MKPVDKNQLVDTLENKVEIHLEQALRVFENLDPDQMLRPAVNGGWSIAQCLEHLNSYGHYYLPLIGSGLSQANGQPAADTFQSTWLGRYLTRSMDPDTGKKKSKAFQAYIPAPDLDAAAVVAEFIRQQKALLQYLAQSRRADLNAVKIPISIARWIKLRLGDVLQFLIAHNERHLRQANRNLEPSIRNYELIK